MGLEPSLMFKRAKLLGNEDLNELGTSGVYEVVNGTNAPTSARYFILNVLASSEVPGTRPAVQVSWKASDGTMKTRVRATTTWGSWTDVGGGGGGSALATTFNTALFDILDANTTPVGLFTTTLGAAVSTGGISGDKTHLQGQLDMLLFQMFETITVIQSLAVLNTASVNLDHTVNPTVYQPSGLNGNVTFHTDGVGANAFHVQLDVGNPGQIFILDPVDFGHAGESVILAPGGGVGLENENLSAITTITIVGGGNPYLVFAWKEKSQKWRLLDYSPVSVTIV